MVMNKFMEFWVPGWERFTRAQRVSCVDFGMSVGLLLLFCCSESVVLALIGLANAIRSYILLGKNHVDIEE